jgi:hypothetical protein
MTHDQGTAPAVENGLLTLAICKPAIRRLAKIGDIILGIGGVSIGLGRVIYAAKITEKMGPGPEYYQKYSGREDAVYKIINGLPKHKGGYYDHAIDPRGQPKYWIKHDVGLNWEKAEVLLSSDYRYFGKKGERLLDRYSHDLKRFLVGWGQSFPILPPGTPFYSEICQLLQSLWSQPEPSTSNERTHEKWEETPPEPGRSLYRAMHREYREWEKANPKNVP